MGDLGIAPICLSTFPDSLLAKILERWRARAGAKADNAILPISIKMFIADTDAEAHELGRRYYPAFFALQADHYEADAQSWTDIPTCKEEGLDVQYLMLRAMFLPGKVTAEQQAFYVDLFQKVTQTPEYKDYMEKQALKPIFLTGNDMLKFLEEDDALNKSLMTEAGFVAK